MCIFTNYNEGRVKSLMLGVKLNMKLAVGRPGGLFLSSRPLWTGLPISYCTTILGPARPMARAVQCCGPLTAQARPAHLTPLLWLMYVPI